MSKGKQNPRRYFKELRFQQLQGFVGLSKAGGFTTAAKSLGVSVPTLWQQVKSLEEYFGAKLVIHSKGQVELTGAGKDLHEICRPIVIQFELIRENFREKQAGKPRQINLVTSYPTVNSELAEALAVFRHAFPDVALSVVEVSASEATLAVQEGRGDFAIASMSVSELNQGIHELTKFPMVLLAPENHPLLRKKTVSVSDLGNHPLVLPSSDTETRRILDTVFTRAKAEPVIALEGNNYGLLLEHALQSGTACVLAKSRRNEEAITEILKKLFQLRDVTNLFGWEALVLIESRKSYNHDYLEAFSSIIRQAFQPDQEPASPTPDSQRNPSSP